MQLLRPSLIADVLGRSQVEPCEIMLKRATQGQDFIRIPGLSPVSVIQPTFHTQILLNSALARRTIGRYGEYSTKQRSFGNLDTLDIK
jgi:hypothetical protein